MNHSLRYFTFLVAVALSLAAGTTAFAQNTQVAKVAPSVNDAEPVNDPKPEKAVTIGSSAAATTRVTPMP